MIEIFNGVQLSFLKRCMRKIGLNIVFPVLIILILLSTRFFNTFSYKDAIFYLFPLYFLYFFIYNIVKSIIYVKEINYCTTSSELILLINRYNSENKFRIHIDNVDLEIFQYGLYTRTRNYYLQIRFNNKDVFRQYDFAPWDYCKMKEVVKVFSSAKKNSGYNS